MNEHVAEPFRSILNANAAKDPRRTLIRRVMAANSRFSTEQQLEILSASIGLEDLRRIVEGQEQMARDDGAAEQ